MRIHTGAFVLIISCCALAAREARAQGACCQPEAICQSATSEAQCSGLGGVFLPGEACSPNPCTTGACCFEQSCNTADAYSCIANGREFAGAGTSCLDDPCNAGVGACCTNGECADLSPEACSGGGGTWLGAGTNCATGPCDVAACCLPGECQELTQSECVAQGGEYQAGADCSSACLPFLPCPPDSLFAQTPDDPSAFLAATSEADPGLRRWENFTGVPGAIAALTFWGLDLDFLGQDWAECAESDPSFDIAFSQDAGGVPGTGVCSYTLIASRTPLGISYLGAELNEYTVALPTTCTLVHGWVSIVGLGDPECWFLWMSSSDGDGQSYCDGCAFSQEGVDLSVCLRGEVGGVFGACCDDNTAVCNDGVEITECLDATERFDPDALCAGLDPPCGIILGACCFGDATCSIDEEQACTTAGGSWLGANTICSSCPCITPCPAGGFAEGEPTCSDGYVDVFNGGCDAETNAFSPIDLCDTVCGQGGVFKSGPGLISDFDWYELSLAAAGDLTWSVEAEFPVLAAIVDGNAGCAGASVLLIDAADECEPLALTASVGPGLYWLVVGASAASDLAACGARYTATVSAEPPGCDCPPDFNHDGLVNASDLAVMLGAWGPNPGHPADLNGDGAVNASDLALLLGGWGPCR